jgi:hypothetical protein
MGVIVIDGASGRQAAAAPHVAHIGRRTVASAFGSPLRAHGAVLEFRS